MHRVARGLAALLGVVLLVAACSGGEPDRSAEPTTSVSSTTLEPTTTGASSTTKQAQAASSAQFRAAKVRLVTVAQLEQPVAMAVRPGDRTLYLVEQVGRVRAVRGGQLDPTPVVDISGEVTAGGEQGLLAWPSRPTAATSTRPTPTGTATHQISELTDARRAGRPRHRGARCSISTSPFANHNGGQLVFGPDGCLYIGLGDGGSGGDPQRQRPERSDTLLGKILRIDPTRRPAARPTASRPTTRSCGRDGAAARDLGLRAAQPVAVLVRPRPPATCGSATSARTPTRRSTSPAGRRRAARNFGWNRLEGRTPTTAATRPDGRTRPGVRVRPHRRRLHRDRRVRLPRSAASTACAAPTSTATTAPAGSGRPASATARWPSSATSASASPA